ncbi:MAG: hydrogenase maturation nickel metallochaperone HypA [Fimbriimonadaceae bacterium]|nr:hydrogenase maturation nickel metallochaperone HypA [Fimbriimonadaceae bacterium]
MNTPPPRLEPTAHVESVRHPCPSCGAGLAFAPGTKHLKCPYCGHEEEIVAPTEGTLRELDIEAYWNLAHLNIAEDDARVQHCNGCGAEFTLRPDMEADDCPFCGSHVIVPAAPERRIPPNGVLPFRLDARKARDMYRQWIGSRFWAPNDLKKRAEAESTLHSMYVPYWTFDSETTTHYTGMRGEHYWVTESYTDSEGRSQTRQVRKTRWYPASGTVWVNFDDELVIATKTLPAKYTQHMQDWQLSGVTDYNAAFLSGYQAMRYDVDLAQGWQTAQIQMRPAIERAIRSDIGGDEQQIHGYDVHHENVTFKHVLLPIYSGAYRYRQKIWRFFINGQTGKVAGEAPVSFWKVLLAVLLGLIIVGGIIYFTQGAEGGSVSSSINISL